MGMEYRLCDGCKSGQHEKCKITTVERLNVICTCEVEHK